MRGKSKSSVSCLAACLLVMGLAACHGNLQPEARTATVYVDAKSDWVNTKLKVIKGQALIFGCEGAWAVAPWDERDRWPDTGPEGHGSHPGELVHQRGNARKELPGVPFGTLLGMVDYVVFPIGSQTRVVMPASGTLYLVINDYPFYRHDNRGVLKVTIQRE